MSKMEKRVTKSRSQIALEQLDEVARQAERRWGVGRLPALVSVDLAERFWRQKEKLDAAITEEATGGSMANVEFEAGRMVNAWMALGAAAEAAGAVPLSPRHLEARLPDGRLVVVCGDPVEAHQIAGDHRMASVWSMEEIARVLWQFEMVNDAKVVWPGARVEEARVDPTRVLPKVRWDVGDELPDGLKAWAAG